MKNFSVEYFVELISQIAEQTISDDIVFSWLEEAVEKVESDYLFVQTRCQETGYDQEAAEEISIGLAALEDYRESLGLLEDFYALGDPAYLQEAANLAVSVHQMFNAAMDENEKAAEDVAWEGFL